MIKTAYLGNKESMTKKEYIEKIANLIINRVRFHAPIVTNDDIDFALLEVVGIDPTLPIFKFDKELDKIFYCAFKLAKESVQFNLILTSQPLVNDKKVLQMENTFIIFEEEMGSTLLANIESLNINYRSHTKFSNYINEDFIALYGLLFEVVFVGY